MVAREPLDVAHVVDRELERDKSTLSIETETRNLGPLSARLSGQRGSCAAGVSCHLRRPMEGDCGRRDVPHSLLRPQGHLYTDLWLRTPCRLEREAGSLSDW